MEVSIKGTDSRPCSLALKDPRVPCNRSASTVSPLKIESQEGSGYTIRYYTILYHTILYYTILYYTILYYTILYYTILYYTILHYTILPSRISEALFQASTASLKQKEVATLHFAMTPLGSTLVPLEGGLCKGRRAGPDRISQSVDACPSKVC